MEFVMSLCDRVTVMSQGTVIVSGTPDVIRRDPRVLDAYLGGSDEDDLADLAAEDGPEVGRGVAGR
jgi:ABC-type multidrug transport system ATPase subunit